MPQSSDTVGEPAGRARGFGSRTFSSLRAYPDFRALWFGTLGTMLGQWVQFVAQGYLVFRLTGSPLQVGIVGFIGGVTAVGMAPFAGSIADRFSRRALLMLMTAISATVALLLAALIIADAISVWVFYATAAIEGFAASVNQPARQVMVYDVVGAEDLPNAVAINSLGSNTMRIVGPALGGALIGLAGAESAFVLQAAAYAFAVLATSRIKARGQPAHAGVSLLQSIGEGLAYARGHPGVRLIIIMAGLPSLLVYPYVQYIPVFAEDVLHTGAFGFGLLASAVGYGSIIGAVLAANLTMLQRRGRVVLWTTFIYMALITAFALSGNFALSFALLVVAGVANSIYLMFNQILIQLMVDDEYRGRVLSLYVMVGGVTPFSALLMGVLIDLFGPQITVACYAGVAAAIVLAIGATSRRLREM